MLGKHVSIGSYYSVQFSCACNDYKIMIGGLASLYMHSLLMIGSIFLFQIGKSDFAILVRYLEGISDFQRSRLIKDAEKIIKNYPNDQTIRLHYKRAKKIVSGIKV